MASRLKSWHFLFLLLFKYPKCMVIFSMSVFPISVFKYDESSSVSGHQNCWRCRSEIARIQIWPSVMILDIQSLCNGYNCDTCATSSSALERERV